MKINKRAGREKELKEKLKNAATRYETVFNKPLSVNDIKLFCDEEEKRERLTFLRDRIGLLSAADVDFVRELIKENAIAPELPPKLDDTDESEDDETLDDIDLDGNEEDEEELTA